MGDGRWRGRLWRLKRSRDLSLEEIAKYYVNMDSVLHARLISVDPELKGQIINSGVRVIPACLLSWPGGGEKVAHRPDSPAPACVEHMVIRGKFGHGGWR